MKKLGFTLIELLTAIAIVAIIAAIVFGVVIKAVASAKGVDCISNLKQIGMALSLYSADNNYSWPPYPMLHNTQKIEPIETQFKENLAQYKLSEANWWCPLDTHKGIPSNDDQVAPFANNPLNSSYVGSIRLFQLGSNVGKPTGSGPKTWIQVIHPAQCQNPSSFPAFSDACFLSIRNDGYSALHTGHGSRSNYLFIDGHVKGLPFDRSGSSNFGDD